jgi:protein CpxP
MEKFTPEQSNQLMLKKMTLELDLSAKQQEQLKPIIAEQNRKRESRMKEMKANKETDSKLSSDERFSRKSQMLDEQIDLKVKMKSILSVDQFEKWDAMKSKQEKRRSQRMQKKMGHRMNAKKETQK